MVTVSKSDYTLIKSVTDIISLVLIGIVLFIKSTVKAIFPKYFRRPKSLDGERVLITGGGGGLGRLLALKFSKLNATVIIWDINEKAIQETVQLVQEAGGHAYGFRCNLADRKDVYKVADITNKKVGQVTILINNAGVASGRLFLDTPDEHIQATFDVNIIAHFWTTKAFLPKMIENNHGHIVTIASMAGHVGIHKMVDYCSSKFAAVGFDEALRLELEQLGIYGVKTTVVCPFFIQSTGMFTDVNCRFLPTLNSSDVADKIVEAVKMNDLFVMIPGYLRIGVALRWFLPWSVVSLILRGLVPDASPANVSLTPVRPTKTLPTIRPQKQTSENAILNHRNPVIGTVS